MDYFEPGLSAEIEPAWLSHFPTFWSELQTHFGPYDPFGDAEAELEQLVMKDNHKAVRFFVEFNRIVSQLGDEYGDSALLRCAYLALPRRLKDEMIHHPKPNSLEFATFCLKRTLMHVTTALLVPPLTTSGSRTASNSESIQLKDAFQRL